MVSGFLQVSAVGYSQTVSISGNDIPLKTVFDAVKKQAGYVFFYDADIIKNSKPVTIHIKNAAVEKVLATTFESQPLTWSIENKTITVVKNQDFDKIPVVTPPPPIDVIGIVTDAEGKPLEGISILIKGTERGTTTDEKGAFSLSRVNESSILIFSGANVETQEINVKGRTELNIKLKIKVVQSQAIEVIVNTGYQTISKERATGSFTYIDNKKLSVTNLASTNFSKGLEGIAAGLLVDQNGGLQIRGVSSIKSDSRPLIVVDGFPIESGNYTINPNDIEDITILKDAAAASIWGVRASNGVVVIKTKSGKNSNGKALFDFTTNFSFDERPDFSYYQKANTPDFIDFEVETIKRGWFNPANANASGYSRVGELFYKKHLGELNDAGVETSLNDLKKLNNLSEQDLFYRSAFQRQFNLSIRGGSQAYKYFISGLYTKQLPAAIGNQNDDIILNIKNSLQVLPKVSLTLGVNSTFNKGKSSAGYDYSTNRPYDLVLDESGNYLSQYPTIPEHLKQGYYDKGYLNWNYNAKQELDNSNHKTNRFEARFNLGLDYEITKGIVFSSKYLNELGFTNADNLQNLNTYYVRNLANNWRVYDDTRRVYVNKFPVGPILDKSKDQFNGWTFRNTVSIDKSFGKLHRVNGVVGTEVRKIANKGNAERYYNYNEKALTVDNFDVLSLSNYTPNYKGDYQSYNWSPGFYERDRRFFSLFANGAYTYKDRYTLSGSARVDQWNLFGTDPKYRSSPIWSAGASWKISGEEFMRNSSFVDRLIARATYGINGNIGNSSPYPIANTGKSFSTQENLLTFSNPENQQLRPEKTAIINLGVDFSVLNYRLSGSVDFYKKKSYDLLGNSVLDPTTGFARAEKNTAKMVNNGLDISLNAKVIQREVSFDIDVNFGYNNNKVLNVLMPSTTANTYITGVSPIEGKPLSYMYSYRWAGLSDKGEPQIYNAKGEIVSWASAEMTDINGLQYAGTLTPPFYGGLMFTLQYKGFSLMPQFTYKMGHVLRLPSPRMNLYGGELNTISQRWQQPGDEAITDIPRVYNNSTGSSKWNNYYRYADIYEGDASFVRLRSLTVSYELPAKYLKNIFSGAQITAQGNNLWLWTANKNDIDPDYYNLRSGYFNFPPVKSFVLSLNLGF
jgi:TonB-linked SusC/RagA family outer membrane protein